MQTHSDIALPTPVVLIVDDDPAICNSLKFSLEIEGYIVHTYRNARSLLEETDLPIYGCLVIDELMPEMGGLELLAVLRSRHVMLPAILITTNPSLKLRQRAALASVPLVEKPLLGNALIDGIRQATQRPH
jgi:FixJ family two-component response regulator